MKTKLITEAVKKSTEERNNAKQFSQSQHFDWLIFHYTMGKELNNNFDLFKEEIADHLNSEKVCWEQFKEEVGEEKALQVFWSYARTQPEYGNE